MLGWNKNSRSLWSTDAIGLNMVSIVCCTDVCTGFGAKMSNSELPDNATAAMPTSRMKALGKDSFYIILLLNSRRLFPVFTPLKFASLLA